VICLSRRERLVIHAMTAAAALVVVPLAVVVVSQPELPRAALTTASGPPVPAGAANLAATR